MFGIGRKDRHGRQVRIEHRGRYTRASRTGGVALRAEKKVGPVNLTANTSKGLRASARVSKGLRVALQNGRFQLIGRWQKGPVGFNLSKTGVSASARNRMGSFNFLKPQYSSFRFAGVQLRGRKAATLQLVYLMILAVIFLARFSVFVLWALTLPVMFVWDFLTGLVEGARTEELCDEGTRTG
ncbi:MAG: hypothetical protein GDA53_05545 [Rhodobacteraceae bacterium]|nr:hypothetical protein [Paracoccaceae bacterium]